LSSCAAKKGAGALLTVFFAAGGAGLVLSQSAPPPIEFREVAEAAGIRFVLQNHPTPRKHMIETMPGGIAAFDYNGDGRTDIYFTNGAAIPSLKKEPGKDDNRLYRNDGGMRFTDVTAQAGVAGEGYSMGAATADFDNDGRVDLFVAGVYRNILYHNLGGGRFEDVSAGSGIRSDRWSVAAGWFDYDNDGLLDLFVVNYAKWTPEWDRFCGDSEKNIRVYCHPKYFEGLPNTLYRNLGKGRFENVTARMGIDRHIGRGMSVAFADFDADGFTDAFVSNDNLPNFLFHNVGGKKFEEAGLLSGVALLDHGKPVAGMGADFRDYDNDGRPDVAMTALAGETFPLFRNEGKGAFRDATYSSRLGPASAAHSGWGNAMADFNNDGWKDVFTANSHVNDLVERFEPFHYREPNSVFLNLGNGTFRECSREAGFTSVRAHRGSAIADFNQDGKLDIAVSALGERAELWENVSSGEHAWLLVKLVGTRSNRDGIGARLRLGSQYNAMTSAQGYASSSHFGVFFGLNKGGAEPLEIVWPSGKVQRIDDPGKNLALEVREPD
jgi:hypothetical protein